MSGRPAARCSSARWRSLALGVSPDRRMRPAWLLIGEAARAKVGFRSTSAKSSRTKGRITCRLYQRKWELGRMAILDLGDGKDVRVVLGRPFWYGASSLFHHCVL